MNTNNALPYNLYHNAKRLTSFEQNKHYVVAEFEDGHNERCDLLVGADGPSSTVRQQLLPDVLDSNKRHVLSGADMILASRRAT